MTVEGREEVLWGLKKGDPKVVPPNATRILERGHSPMGFEETTYLIVRTPDIAVVREVGPLPDVNHVYAGPQIREAHLVSSPMSLLDKLIGRRTRYTWNP